MEQPQGAEVSDAVGLGLPRPIRRLMPLLARQPLFSFIVAVLTGIFRLAVRLRILGLEVFAARGIGSLEVQRGVLDRT